jgi:hypothetical protein
MDVSQFSKVKTINWHYDYPLLYLKTNYRDIIAKYYTFRSN